VRVRVLHEWNQVIRNQLLQPATHCIQAPLHAAIDEQGYNS
jgi:hypothetical protein